MESQNSFKIVIKKVEAPFSSSFEKELEYLCKSFGFFEPIDREKTASTIFKEILINTEKGIALTSTELSRKVGMSRGAVINHLNNLIRTGLIIKDGRHYYARSKSTVKIIKEIEDEIELVFRKMERIAKQIDKRFGID